MNIWNIDVWQRKNYLTSAESCYFMSLSDKLSCLLDSITLLSQITLHWRHNEPDGVSNHQPRDCLLNCLFRCRSKKTSKLRATGLCAENSPGTGEFPAQKASNAENVSIWWRHHALQPSYPLSNSKEITSLSPLKTFLKANSTETYEITPPYYAINTCILHRLCFNKHAFLKEDLIGYTHANFHQIWWLPCNPHRSKWPKTFCGRCILSYRDFKPFSRLILQSTKSVNNNFTIMWSIISTWSWAV